MLPLHWSYFVGFQQVALLHLAQVWVAGTDMTCVKLCLGFRHRERWPGYLGPMSNEEGTLSEIKKNGDWASGSTCLASRRRIRVTLG